MTKRKPFKEVYPIKDTYKRFDSRNTSFAQSRRALQVLQLFQEERT